MAYCLPSELQIDLSNEPFATADERNYSMHRQGEKKVRELLKASCTGLLEEVRVHVKGYQHDAREQLHINATEPSP